ncbi:MAG TPA: response regulator transcription factor [Candidatus Krumholzibacteria bacterium]|nr:response regulator transcription factor [Candidatus Krumholzibacteria bacterium]
MSGPVRILLADDHVFVCELLKVRLHDEPGLRVVHAAGDTDRALQAARALAPDVAVLDIDMPGPPVFGVIEKLRAERPALRVMLLSAFVSDHHVQQALDVGAAGYVVKTEPLDVIVEAVRTVAGGGVYFSPDVKERIVVERSGPVLRCAAGTRLALLTPREREVLAAIARGLAKKQVAELLSISVKTVDRHCVQLMEKLQIHDRVDLARFAIREGIVNP